MPPTDVECAGYCDIVSDSDDDSEPDNTGFYFGLKPQRCAVCSSTSRLFRCRHCKVVSYCGTAHQSQHRSEHEAVCRDIKKAVLAYVGEENALRADTNDIFHGGGDPFVTRAGLFWGVITTRKYMRARFAAAEAILKADTQLAAETALEHFTDMLRLCRTDNLGVRDQIPALMLRLGREQECYDFIKWWATVDDNYAWLDPTQPYLDIHGADVLEPVDAICNEYVSLSHLVTLLLLKLRLVLDLEAYQVLLEEELDSELENDGWFGPRVGKLVRSMVEDLEKEDVEELTQVAEDQYLAVLRAVNRANPHIWEVLIDEGPDSPPPPYFAAGSMEEAVLVRRWCRKAWEETLGALERIDDDVVRLIYAPAEDPKPVQGQAMSASGEHARDTAERKRGVGDAFPSVFTPERWTATPIGTFPATRLTQSGGIRFISSDKKRILVYVDGACPNNGDKNARAGWAVVYGPDDIASGPLEDKGPFGEVYVATSNRAELRASTAALRLCDWKVEGFDQLIIATDSSYVVDGATTWTRTWIRKGWKTSKGTALQNRDLWEMLLGEVERWKSRGLAVAFWKIPRELNGVADAAAKAACEKSTPKLEFADLSIHDKKETDQETRHVITLCLEYEFLFDDIHGNLISRITSKAKMARATNPQAALDLLSRTPHPAVILVADPTIINHRQVFRRVKDCLYAGATVVLGGCFSTMASTGQLTRVFAELGLPWRRGLCQRLTTRLCRQAVDSRLASRLPASYSQNAAFLKNVSPSAVWYTSDAVPNEAAVAWTKVRSGWLGYVGDVNGEKGSEDVVLAMCGLLD